MLFNTFKFYYITYDVILTFIYKNISLPNQEAKDAHFMITVLLKLVIFKININEIESYFGRE